MKRNIVAIVLVFVLVSIGWLMLGGVTRYRFEDSDVRLESEVKKLWGSAQKQQAPGACFTDDSGAVIGIRPESSEIEVDLDLEYRKKGDLWYSTYRVRFDGEYVIVNPDSVTRTVTFDYSFPATEGVFDDFSMILGGDPVGEVKPVNGKVSKSFDLGPGQPGSVRITYASQGLDEWWYVFGSDVEESRGFSLTMTTDFDDIDFPPGSISPPVKTELGGGWELKWEYSDLISSVQIGMLLPQKLNPGPVVSEASFYAPLALLLFLLMLFIITMLKKVDIHPVNYLFIAAGFFSFSLLFAELTDHMDINLAFLISASASILLVVTYMRLVVGLRFALGWIMMLQLVYFVAFSYSFLMPGYTGLFIVAFCVLTLFLVMQLTGRIDWNRYFDMDDDAHPRRPPGPMPATAAAPWPTPYFSSFAAPPSPPPPYGNAPPYTPAPGPDAPPGNAPPYTPAPGPDAPGEQ